jgi:hypothetical protein
MPIRKLLFGWLYWVLGTPGNRTSTFAVALLVGLMALVSLTIMLSRAPERLGRISNPETTMSLDVRCERLVSGGSYFIEVNGQRHECSGADTWCPDLRPVKVVYDRSRPAHCRAAHNLGRPSKWELAALLNDLAGLALGLAALLIRPDDTHRARSVLGHALFILCVVISLGSWWAGLSVMK